MHDQEASSQEVSLSDSRTSSRLMQRDYRLDFARAICILLVLLLHTNMIQPSSYFLSTFVYLCRYYIMLLAVPIFFIISFYIFFIKCNSVDYFRHRMKHLFDVFFFWIVIQQIFCHIVQRSGTLAAPSDVMAFLPTIGFYQWPPLDSLQIQGLYYYLYDLIILTAMAYPLLHISERNRLRVSLGIAIISLAAFSIYPAIHHDPGIASLENFVVYIPLGYILSKYPKVTNYRWLFMTGFLISSFIEIILGHYYPPAYARIPVVFGSLGIFTFMLSRNSKERSVFNFFSHYSLGIYVIHRYYQFIAIEIILLSGASRTMLPLVSGIIAVSLTILSVYLIGRTPLRKFV
jgi:hypothetical protein